jgi:hypothetical protein
MGWSKGKRKKKYAQENLKKVLNKISKTLNDYVWVIFVGGKEMIMFSQADKLQNSENQSTYIV